MSQHNQARVKVAPGTKERIYVGLVGDPKGVEVVVAGHKGNWVIYGIRGFGVGFLNGDRGYTLTQESIRLLDSAVADFEVDELEPADG